MPLRPLWRFRHPILNLAPPIRRSLSLSSAAFAQSRSQQSMNAKRKAPVRGNPRSNPRSSRSESEPLPGPIMTDPAIRKAYLSPGIDAKYLQSPKDFYKRYVIKRLPEAPPVQFSTGLHNNKEYFRAVVYTDDKPDAVIGVGDHPTRARAERLACLSAVLQLFKMGLLQQVLSSSYVPPTVDTILSDGTKLNTERAKVFMNYYCHKYSFGNPEIVSTETRGGWESVMTVGGRKIGIGTGVNKKLSLNNCYLDVVQYLDGCDAELWKNFLVETKGKGDAIGLAPPVWLHISARLNDRLKELSSEISHSQLFANRPQDSFDSISRYPSPSSSSPVLPSSPPPTALRPKMDQTFHHHKSQKLRETLDAYRADPTQTRMRAQREALPIYTKAREILDIVESQDVTICMAATGSGKTTQIPQILLDDWIARGQGSKCNIICTQPRRIAAISVAERVAAERRETVGKQVGYQVRFDAKLPMAHGSITFCTTGIFLKRMQGALEGSNSPDDRSLDDVTHMIVDEVHERDVDTDLTLVVLKRLLKDRRARNKPLKVILMSATIDPTLFQTYFADAQGNKARTIDIPGRSFPVEKRYLEDIIGDLARENVPIPSWIFSERSVVQYLNKEVGPGAVAHLRATGGTTTTLKSVLAEGTGEDLEMPFPIVALTIAHVLRTSNSGHVLVFLPGWEEITAVQRILLEKQRFPLDIDFNDRTGYSIHLLHSTIPVAEQQAVFEPAASGVRRVILATNIAETSITIPDVVYVVDTGKVKEKRYDPERHMSSLVSAWVGSSNLNQRAGRAGRHRPGQYYGIMSRSRMEVLHPYQMVEMKRVDLSNVVMHVKALDFRGMTVEEIFAALIEPPAPERVEAALQTLEMVGALDAKQRLTSLGRVLQQLPIEAAIGRLVLYGCMFKCLDSALTLAAILTNREPFMAPAGMKQEAQEAKASWTENEFRSDPLAAVRAYDAWWNLQSRGKYSEANSFCNKYFLSKPTLLMMQKVKAALLQALFSAGIIEVSAGGRASTSPVFSSQFSRGRHLAVPPELNIYSDSLPVMAGLIALASQPNFAIRTSDRVYRTPQDKSTIIHPSSVNHMKWGERENSKENGASFEKHLVAFVEKVRNVSVASTSANAQTFLRNTTRLDIMTYVLFGAYRIKEVERGLECDEWLPVQGSPIQLSQLQRLKAAIEACLLRVFEGIATANTERREARLRRYASPRPSQANAIDDRKDDDDERDDADMDENRRVAKPLSKEEIMELDFLTRDVVRVLDQYKEERVASQSRRGSRPATPYSVRASPSAGNIALPSVSESSFNSGVRQLLDFGSSGGSGHCSEFRSRPQTPLREAHSRV